MYTLTLVTYKNAYIIIGIMVYTSTYDCYTAGTCSRQSRRCGNENKSGTPTCTSTLRKRGLFSMFKYNNICFITISATDATAAALI